MITELKQSEKYLKDKGVQSPQADAEGIFMHLLNCDRAKLYTSDASLSESQHQIIYEFIQRRATGEPLQYILKQAYFYGFKFKSQKGVFIPRPETELLIDAVLRKVRNAKHEIRNILDLCTGCGNVAISLTKTLQHYRIFASDVSVKATSLAKENALYNNISDSVIIRNGDLFHPWQDKKDFFDAIVCNPPYIVRQELKHLPCDVKNEPLEALDGGEDGLDFYRKIIKKAPLHLKEKGYILFEISPDVVNGVTTLLNNDFCNLELIKDYNNRERIIVAQLNNNGL